MAEKAARIAKCTRTTNETDITLEFNIDGKGQSKIDTGIGFFDHMLTSFAKHGFFDLNVTVKGDLYVIVTTPLRMWELCWARPSRRLLETRRPSRDLAISSCRWTRLS